MRRTLLVLALLCGLAGVALFWALSWNDRSTTEATRASAVQPETAAESDTTVPVRAPDVEEARTRAELETSARAEVAPPSTEPTSGLAELRGRFLFADGSPAVGVQLKLKGWVGNDERARQHGVPTDWKDLTAATDAQGRFSIHFDPPPAFQFVLRGELEGFGKVSWRWFTLPVGALTDVGDTTLVGAATIRGRVIDEQGRFAGGKWVAYGEPVATTAGGGRDATLISCPADPATGDFVLRGLPTGALRLRAYSQVAGWVEGPTLTLEPNQLVEADVVYRGPSLLDRITLSTFHAPLPIFEEPQAGSIRLLGLGFEREAKRTPGTSSQWSFDDLPPGTYTLRIDDPFFEPHSERDLKPGSSVKVGLRANAAVALEVVDPTGRRVDDYGLRIDFAGGGISPRTFELRGRGAPSPEGEIYRGLLPADIERVMEWPDGANELVQRVQLRTPRSFDLLVDSDGFATGLARVEGLRIGETRAVRIQLAPKSTLAGRIVVTPEGAAKDVTVLLADGKLGLDALLELRLDWEAPLEFVTSTRTDANGAFEFDNLRAGSYRVVARFHRELHAASETFELQSGERREIRLGVPRLGGIEGRILAGPRNLANAWVEARPQAHPHDTPRPWPLVGEPPPRAALDADGRFSLPLLRSGSWLLELTINPWALERDRASWSAAAGTSLTLGSVSVWSPEVATVEFNLGEREPGGLRLRVTLDGKPARRQPVKLEALASDRTVRTVFASAETDGEGLATFERLEPGLWSCSLRSSTAPRWWTRNARPFLIEPGRVTEEQVDVVLHPGRLRILDATSSNPRARFEFHLHTAELTRVSSVVRTDADGYIDCLLPEGRYLVTLGGTQHTIEWTAAGPVPSEVKL